MAETTTSMTAAEQSINTFFVEVFHDILRLESDSLRQSGCSNLPVSELHMLDAIKKGADGMGKLAKALSLSPGSVTTAAKTLESKGYLLRQRSQIDKRRVTVQLTERAEEALRHHAEFHRQLIQSVSTHLDDARMDALGTVLNYLHTFFKTYPTGGTV